MSEFNLDSIDKRMMPIDDFLDDINKQMADELPIKDPKFKEYAIQENSVKK